MAQSKKKLPPDFALSPGMIQWCEKTYPQIVPQETFVRFVEASEAEGWVAANWEAKFKRVVRAGVDNRWTGIVVYKKGWVYDPQHQALIHEARKAGFRDPDPMESAAAYRTALDLSRQPSRPSSPPSRPSPLTALRNVLKNVTR